MHKQPEVTGATRQAFLDALLELMREKPVSRITVREITALAGRNRTTFYRYFSDVYALYDALRADVLARIAPQALEVLRQVADEARFVAAVENFYADWKPYIEVLFQEPYHADLAGIKEQVMSQIQGKLPLADERRIGYLVECYFAVVTALVGRWVSHPDDFSLRELALLMRGILWEGLLRQFAVSG